MELPNLTELFPVAAGFHPVAPSLLFRQKINQGPRMIVRMFRIVVRRLRPVAKAVGPAKGVRLGLSAVKTSGARNAQGRDKGGAGGGALIFIFWSSSELRLSH